MTDKVIVFKGKPGASSVNGINGLGVSDVQGDVLESPIFNVLCTNKLARAGNLNFDRGSLAFHNNRHHKNVWARNTSTTNFILYSEDFTQWDDGTNKWSIIGSTTDPDGGSLATEINLDADTDDLVGLGPIISDFPDASMTVGGYVTLSFWLKIISGTISALDVGQGSTKITMPAPTASYQRFKISVPVITSGFNMSINPRGKSGARLALFGVQLEDNLTSTDYIKTVGAKETVTFTGEPERESDKGWLIEEEKENIVIYSAELSKSNWVKTNLTIDTFTGDDPFGDTDQSIRLVWGTVAEVTLAGDTGTLTASTAYTVSFWAYITAGSLSSITVALGGGTAVTMPQVDVSGFVRINAAITSGSGSGIIITANSPNLTASLNISGIQVELGTLTSYIKTGTLAQTREPDIVKTDIPFNIPRPDKTWSFIFRHKSVLNNSAKKFIFTNNETGSTEFSCYFTNANLTLKNGASETTISALTIEKISMTFSGSTLKIYNESTLVISTSISPTSFLAATLYIGMNSAKANAINAHISNFMFYDVELTANEIIYLMGA